MRAAQVVRLPGQQIINNIVVVVFAVVAALYVSACVCLSVCVFVTVLTIRNAYGCVCVCVQVCVCVCTYLQVSADMQLGQVVHGDLTPLVELLQNNRTGQANTVQPVAQLLSPTSLSGAEQDSHRPSTPATSPTQPLQPYNTAQE